MPGLTPSPWNMKKEQLLQELNEVVHRSWTAPELRQILIEQRSLEKHHPAGREDGEQTGVQLPSKPTRGLMIKLIRDARSTPAQTVVPFGRFKGQGQSQL